jgi:hypothetical protein
MTVIEVEGYQQLVAAFAVMAKETKPAVRKGLKPSAVLVAQEGKAQAEQRGLVLSGALESGIKPSIRGTTAYVRDATMRTERANAPFSYPRLHEYAHGGERAFLRPALANKADEVTVVLGMAIQELLNTFSNV